MPKGDRPLKIKWYLNGKHISHHTKGISTSVFGSQASILNIMSIEPHHRGDYTCIASNYAGKVEYTAQLDVTGIWFTNFLGAEDSIFLYKLEKYMPGTKLESTDKWLY